MPAFRNKYLACENHVQFGFPLRIFASKNDFQEPQFGVKNTPSFTAKRVPATPVGGSTWPPREGSFHPSARAQREERALIRASRTTNQPLYWFCNISRTPGSNGLYGDRPSFLSSTFFFQYLGLELRDRWNNVYFRRMIFRGSGWNVHSLHPASFRVMRIGQLTWHTRLRNCTKFGRGSINFGYR